MTKGRKLRPRFRFAPGRMPFQQWINSRRGLDISISRFAVYEPAIVKQATEAMHCTGLVHRPAIRKATNNGRCAWVAGFAVAASLDPGQSTDAYI
jgi:hypothetical protein